MVPVSRFPIGLNQRSRCCVLGTEFAWLAACNDSEGQLVSLHEVILSYSQEFQLFRRCVGLRQAGLHDINTQLYRAATTHLSDDCSRS